MDGTMLIVSPSFVGVFSFRQVADVFVIHVTRFTKLRRLPSSVKEMLPQLGELFVRWPSASPTVAAWNSAEARFPAYGRSGVGIITFHGHFVSPLLSGRALDRGAVANFDAFGRKLLPIVIHRQEVISCGAPFCTLTMM